MNILKPKNYLLEQEFGVVFLQLPPSPHVSQQVASSANFHHVHYVRLGVKRFVESHNVLVPGPLQNVVLLPDFLQGLRVAHHLLTDRLQSHELLRQPVDGQVYFTKCSLSDDLSNFVVLSLGIVLLVLNPVNNRLDDLLFFSKAWLIYQLHLLARMRFNELVLTLLSVTQ